jgi:hypothetical protein
MAQFYTLEEAAQKLNLPVDEFKRRLREDLKDIVPMRDGSTLRFRASVIEEKARTMGMGSSEELPLADSSVDFTELTLAPEDGGSMIKKMKPPAKKADDDILNLDSDEVFLLNPEGSGKKGKKKSDSDSDVRLEKADKPKKKKPAEDADSILTEELELPSTGGSGKLSGKSGKLSSAKLKGDSGKLKKDAEPDSSEFELSLDVDSDEFELSLTPDSSEEVSLGDLPVPRNKSGQSGINLNKPADSGLSLEKKSDDEIDFELSLDTPGSSISKKKLGSSKKLVKDDSDSEFELTLEEPSDLALDIDDPKKKGDIFEATDFEIPSLDDESASEAVALDDADTDLESSDFDLAIDDGTAEDDSASQVVALDEDEEPAPKKKKSKVQSLRSQDEDDEEMELEEGPSASDALEGVDDEEYEVSEAADEVVVASSDWGAIPVVMLVPTFIVMFLGGLMAYELLHSVWGYQQANRPTSPLIGMFADTK